MFDGTKSLPYVEEDQPAPLSAYGRSKLDGEDRIRRLRLRAPDFAHGLGLRGKSGRNFLTTMLRLATEREELRVVDDQVGAPTFAGFIAAATVQMLRAIFSNDAARERVSLAILCIWSMVAPPVGSALLPRSLRATWFSSACAHRALLPIKSRTFRLVRVDRRIHSSVPKRARTVWNLQVPEWRESLADCLSQLR